MCKEAFFEMFCLPKDGKLYSDDYYFDFEEFMSDYKKMCTATKWLELFNNLCIETMVKYTENTLMGDVENTEEGKLLLLVLAILIDSYQSRCIRRVDSEYNQAVLGKLEELMSFAKNVYPDIVPLITITPVISTEFVVHCWDNVRKSDGMLSEFEEFDEYVVDPSNMMSEVMRFV